MSGTFPNPSIETLLAYGLLLIGLTNLVGITIGSAAATLAFWAKDGPIKSLVTPFRVFETTNGMSTVLAAFGLFHLLGVRAPASIVLVAIAWDTLPILFRRMDPAGRGWYLSGVSVAAAAVFLVRSA